MKLSTSSSIIEVPKGATISHRLDCISKNYAQLTPNIDVQYVFEQKIDTGILKKSLIELIKHMPSLAGRADFKAMKVCGKKSGVPFVVIDNYPSCAKEYGQLGDIQRNRREFVITPTSSNITKGKAPLMGVKVTNFSRGGCILGITISHVLTDAYGFHILVHHLSSIFMQIKEGTYSANLQQEKIIFGPPISKFGKNRSEKALALDMEKARWVKPLGFGGILGKWNQSISSKIVEYVRKTDREVIHFTKEQTEHLKEVITKESGEPWVTTYEAFFAHFSKIMAELSEVKSNKMQLVTSRDFRGRIDCNNKEDHPYFAGNALFVYNILADFNRPYIEVSRGEIASHLRNASKQVDKKLIKMGMDFVYDCLSLGYSYPGINIKLPLIAMNSQIKLSVYDVNFGNGKPLRVIPQDIGGDSALFFPDGNGGVEVYIRDIMNTKRQKKLLTDEWQDKIFSF